MSVLGECNIVLCKLCQNGSVMVHAFMLVRSTAVIFRVLRHLANEHWLECIIFDIA